MPTHRRALTSLLAALAVGLGAVASVSGSSLGATSAGQPPRNLSLPRLSGTAAVGQSLSTTTGEWSGSFPISYAYQWLRCDASTGSCSAIPGATAKTYQATAADSGATLAAAVTARNTAGQATARSATSAVVVGAAGTPPTNTSPPSVSGQLQVGQTLTASPGSWTGTAPISYSYQWQRCSSPAATSCSDIPGATGQGYEIAASDAGDYLRVGVAARNSCASGCGASATVYSAISAQAVSASAGTGASAQLYVSPTGSDSAPCTQAAPCRTFNRAYHVATPGEVVAVEGGTYPDQSIRADATKTSPAVVFEPDAGAQVTLGNLFVQGSYVSIQDMAVTGIWYVGVNSKAYPQASQPHDVTIQNLTAARMFITGASNVSVLGGSIGPSVDSSSEIKACESCAYAPTNIVLDGVTFHDYTRATSGAHVECLMVYPAQNLTIRRSRFLNCAVMDVFFQNYGSAGDLRNITIENDVFDQPGSHGGALSHGYVALNFDANGRTITNVRIAYNSLLVGDIPGLDASGVSGAVVEANVAPRARCYGGVAYRYNVWTNWKCGVTDRVAPTGFTDPASYDFEPVAGAASINAGNTAAYPSTDATGRTRYLGAAPDSGAYEAG